MRALLPLLIGLVSTGGAGAQERDPQPRAVTVDYCRDEATRSAVMAEADRQGVVGTGLGVRAARFETMDLGPRSRRYCGYTLTASNGVGRHFAVTPEGGERRFTFQRLD